MGKRKSGGGELPALEYLCEALRPLAVPIDSLVQDPANARRHDRANLDAIKASLRVFGQRKPVVANRRTGAVEAGNGTLEAARELGWTHLACVLVDDDAATAAGFAIADNRAGELAEWDRDALDGLLRAVETDDQDLAAMLARLAEEQEIVPAEEQPPADAGLTAEVPAEKWLIIIDCASEARQVELLGRFQEEGLECRALVS